MDEKILLLKSLSIEFVNDFVDDNLKNLTRRISKHNNYSTRVALDILNIKYKFFENESIESSLSAEQKKENVG